MPDVWPYWLGTGGTVGSQIYNASTWQAWVQPTITITNTTAWEAWQPTAATNLAQTIWIQWQTTGTAPQVIQPVGIGSYNNPPLVSRELTPEEKHAQNRQRLISRQRSHAREIRRRIAERRADLLLSEHLNDEQLAEYRRERHFHVVTPDGLRRYRIDYGSHGNVRLVAVDGEPPRSKRGNPLRVGSRFCCYANHPDGSIPAPDHMLTQKLLLESGGEEQFLAVANVS